MVHTLVQLISALSPHRDVRHFGFEPESRGFLRRSFGLGVGHAWIPAFAGMTGIAGFNRIAGYTGAAGHNWVSEYDGAAGLTRTHNPGNRPTLERLR